MAKRDKMMFDDFNSIKVRLKHPYAPQYKCEFVFQFHKGTIKTFVFII